MANKAELIYSVREVFTRYLDGKYKYYIPEYQRGYKWDSQQIEELLNDVDNFKSNGNEDRFYCIQNITIVEKKEEQCYHVIDGQQRLTTLVVLLSYLGEAEIVKDKLKYAVRPETDEFITHYILKKIEQENWADFLKSKEGEKDYDHQDIYYLFTAYNTIKKWFESGNKSKDEFRDKLLDHVKLIVNKPSIDSDEQELFMNLNTGKVSLDGADLVRALLITNVAKEELAGNNLEDTKNIVRLNEKRVRIGLELDEISAWWNQPEIKNYYTWLNKITVPETETIAFDSTVYPVNLLYKLYVSLPKEGKEKSKEERKTIRLSDFEGHGNYTKLYKEIITLHRTVKDWYQDCEIYHFVEFLITHTSFTFEKIWELWTKAETTRKLFIDELKERIKKEFNEWVNGSVENENSETIEDLDKNSETKKDLNKIFKAIADLEENWFENKDLHKILILLDIIQIVNSHKSGQGTNKLPFLDACFFKHYSERHSEDKEHVFPQTPIGQKDIKKEELKDIVIKYLEVLKEENKNINKNINKNKNKNVDVDVDVDVDINSINLEINWKNPDDLTKLKDEINKKIGDKVQINSIGNLCLLDKGINRGYGNDFYTSKRNAIIKNSRNGEYIRPHTLNVFIKGFLDKDDSGNLNIWTNSDIEANAQYIKEQLTNFFNIKDEK